MDLPVSGKSGGPSLPNPSGSPSHWVAPQRVLVPPLNVTELGSWGAFGGGLAHPLVISLDTRSQLLQCTCCSQLPAYANYPGPQMLTSPKYFSFTFKVRILWAKKTNSTGEESLLRQGKAQDGFWEARRCLFIPKGQANHLSPSRLLSPEPQQEGRWAGWRTR